MQMRNARLLKLSLFWTFSFSCVLPVSVMAVSNDPLIDSSYSNALRCGPNALFVLLTLAGHSDITLEKLGRIPITTDATSLAALRDAVKEFGVNTEIRRYDPANVASMHMPALAQVRSDSSSITPYHFVVMYKVDAQRVSVIDGTTGQSSYILRSRLHHFWTGVALTEPLSTGLSMPSKLPLLLIATCLTFANFSLLAYSISSHFTRLRQTSKVLTN